MKKINVESIEGLFKELNSGIKPKITNKSPRGKKEAHLSRLKKHGIIELKDDYFNNKKLSASYMRWFDTTCTLLTEFFGHTPTICEITKKDLERFKLWLQTKTETRKAYSHNAMVTTLNRLRMLLLHGVELELIAKSPMPKKGFIPGYEKGRRDILNYQEIEKICNVPDNTLSAPQIRAKYVFLFMTAMAIGYGELKTLRSELIKRINNALHLSKNRIKTGEKFDVTFSPFALQIYQKLEQLKIKFYDLPSIEFMNRSIRELMILAGVNKNITTYVGRHTFATHWLSDGNSINALKTIMGHTDIKTTQIYESIIPEKLIEKQNQAYAISDMHNIKLN